MSDVVQDALSGTNELKKNQKNRRVTISGTLVPSSPMMQRPGLDADVILAIQDLDTVIKDMRAGLLYPSARRRRRGG
jgi:hypothetical protein